MSKLFSRVIKTVTIAMQEHGVQLCCQKVVKDALIKAARETAEVPRQHWAGIYHPTGDMKFWRGCPSNAVLLLNEENTELQSGVDVIDEDEILELFNETLTSVAHLMETDRINRFTRMTVNFTLAMKLADIVEKLHLVKGE